MMQKEFLIGSTCVATISQGQPVCITHDAIFKTGLSYHQFFERK